MNCITKIKPPRNWEHLLIALLFLAMLIISSTMAHGQIVASGTIISDEPFEAYLCDANELAVARWHWWEQNRNGDTIPDMWRDSGNYPQYSVRLPYREKATIMFITTLSRDTTFVEWNGTRKKKIVNAPILLGRRE